MNCWSKYEKNKNNRKRKIRGFKIYEIICIFMDINDNINFCIILNFTYGNSTTLV